MSAIPRGRAAQAVGRVNCSQNVHRTRPRRRRRHRAMTDDARPAPHRRGAGPTARRCPSPRRGGRSWNRRRRRRSPCRSRTGRTSCRGNRTRSSPAPPRLETLYNVRAHVTSLHAVARSNGNDVWQEQAPKY